MTGLTTEITSVSEALTKLAANYIETHGRAPRSFELGPEEYCRLSCELNEMAKFTERQHTHTHEFLGIKVAIGERPGIFVVNH